MRRRWLRDRCTPHSCRVGGRSGSDSAVTARRQAGGAELAVQRRADAAAVAEGRGVRAARLRAIKADIAERLAHDDLTVAAVASRQRISESYVRKLLESEGSSFFECVLGERLIRAHRVLTDPRFAGRSIASVAFDAGFGDVSYFNRSFRRRFGATPSEIRAEAVCKN